MTLFPRSSGILLHPTSLPGRYGIGDLGDYAFRFVDYLVEHGQTIWQVLPLGPTSYGDSPYQCLSAFAGNPNLISLDKLVDEGWLTAQDLTGVPAFPKDHVDYGPVIEYHTRLLDVAAARFKSSGSANQRTAYDKWCQQNSHWLEDWVLFIALKDSQGGRPWVEWPAGEALRDPAALDAARARLADRLDAHRFRQWVFHAQWHALKAYANGRGVRFVGDLPIFVAHDSSDVWAYRDRFYLDAKGNPTVIAGVPPDYFSATGQRWGNPLYRWDVMAGHGYSWWISRMQAILDLVDLVRIDHFRAFEDYWEIPASEPTAVKGKWVKGPNVAFFNVLKEKLGGNLPIIAEDLGEITEEVVILRDTLGLPGMKILQFAWSGPENPFQLHNHVVNCVVYTGTHDNNTTMGWWSSEADAETRQNIANYIGHEVGDPRWAMVRLGMMSVAHTFVLPMQDLLGYGEEARMNTPGRESGNWGWRFTEDKFNDPAVDHLAYLTRLYRRHPDQQEVTYGDAARKK